MPHFSPSPDGASRVAEHGKAPAHGFPAIATRDSRVLVLGSMPGLESLRQRQYYAHPRNTFWPIVADVLGFDSAKEYGERVAALLGAGVALWDVLKSCIRKSSLDSDIDPATMAFNDFATFLSQQRRLQRICFNGAQAELLFSRFVLSSLPPLAGIELVCLPSTSPAHFTVPVAAKKSAWQAIRIA